MTRPIRHSETDACPGALRLHAAADGPLARVRLPGGLLTGAQLAELGAIAAEWGDGGLELTSRANLQLRALNHTTPASLAARLHAAGLLPSQTHEVVRNIAAPALADAPTRALVHTLDHALCADPPLAALPGRFLFAIGNVPLTADLTALPTAGPAVLPTAGPAVLPTADPAVLRSPATYAILLAGRDEGLRVPADRVVEALLAGARAFLDERAAAKGEPPAPPPRDRPTTPAWRLAELPDGPRRIAARLATVLGIPLSDDPAEPIHGAEARDRQPAPPGAGSGPARAAGPSAFAGVVEQPDGRVAVGAIVPLGRLTGVQIKVLVDADRLVLTPERGVVIPDLAPEAAAGWLAALTEAGLPVEADSRWSGVTACAGRPGCAKSLADVRADAVAATRFVDGLPVHWVGCARGCGSPAGPHVRVEAADDGYAVTTHVPGRAADDHRNRAAISDDKSDKSDLDSHADRPGDRGRDTPSWFAADRPELAEIAAAARSPLAAEHPGLAEIVATARSPVAADHPDLAEIVATARRS